MDKKQVTWTKQAGVTPGKLGLIAVLAVALAGVLYSQYAPQSKPAAALQPAPRPATRAAAAANPRSASALAAGIPTAERKKTRTVTNWQSPALKQIATFDPFALPAAFPQPQSAEEAALAQSASAQDASQQQADLEAARVKTENELAGLKQQAVKVMLTRNDEFVAIVGDQVVHVGDELDGFKVIAIDSDGVHVAKELTP